MRGRHDHLHACLAGTDGMGHNWESLEAAQWQTPHVTHDHDHSPEIHDEYRDLDLVERAFIQGFSAASDPTSFLRLTGVPFEGTTKDGVGLKLLRVEQSQSTDIGSITPHLGGKTFRYDPLPQKLVSQRNELAFIYFDGRQTVCLDLQEAKSLGRANSPDKTQNNHQE